MYVGFKHFSHFVALLLLSFSLACQGEGKYGEEAATDQADGLRGLCFGPSASSLSLVDELPTPIQRTGVGNGHLAITTVAPTAQQWFDLGLNYLHGFWHVEAYRAFKQAVLADPNCAMGYWGMGMCQPGFGGEDFSPWQKFAAQAMQLSEGTQPIEQALIKALFTTTTRGLIAAVPAWQSVAQQFPNNPEVVAACAIMLRQAMQSEQEFNTVKNLLEKGLEQHPDHAGILHFYVHLLEGTDDFLLAKPAAQRLLAVAPNVPHLTHMPGHLYFLEGDYQQAASAFEQAKQQEQQYHETASVPPSVDQNYMHNLHYLAVTYAELGERDKALAAAEEFSNITLRQTDPSDGGALVLLYEGRILPALTQIRFGAYKEAAKNIQFWLATPVVPATNEVLRSYLQAMLAYCYGMDAAVNQRNITAAVPFAHQMDQHLDRFANAIQTKRVAEKILAMQSYQIMTVRRYELAGWLANMDAAATFDPEPWDMARSIEAGLPYDEPPRLMYPVGESLMRLQLYRKDRAAAEAAKLMALARRPKSPIIEYTYSSAK